MKENRSARVKGLVACIIVLAAAFALGMFTKVFSIEELREITFDFSKVLKIIIMASGIIAAEKAIALVLSFIKPSVAKTAGRHNFNDYKTMLQEIVQKNREEVLSYRVASQSGPDHDKTFVMEVLLNSNVVARGSGHSKKEAEQAAAHEALKLMGIKV